MTGTAAEIKHGTSQPGQVPPDEVDVSLVLLRPVADQADVLLGHRRVRGTHALKVHLGTVEHRPLMPPCGWTQTRRRLTRATTRPCWPVVEARCADGLRLSDGRVLETSSPAT